MRSISTLLKHSLLRTGHYRRALAHAELPGVAVLCYHGIRDDAMPPGAIPFQYLHMPASTFESHCKVIRTSCDPISVDDWRAALAGGPPLPKRPVLITFDDGYRSVLTLGAPILEKYELPAAVFVCTGPMQSRRLLWFDAVASREGESAVQYWKARDHESWSAACTGSSPALDERDPRALMTPDELAVLSRSRGIEIGGHTVRHPILAQAPIRCQQEEIEQNLASIREWTGKPVRSFAYPNGRPGVDFTRDTTAILGRAGVDIAFTTQPVFATNREPALERSRFVMLDEISDSELAHRLTYSWPR